VSKPLLQVRNLTTKFGEGPNAVVAVNNVSFEVSAGETVAIVGESGSGKSVTALSILGLVPDPPGRITGGEIVFDGIELTKLNEDEMRSIRGNRIAMIFQEPMTSLNPSLTIGLQISEPINLHKRLPWQKAYDKAKELLDRVRMPDAQSRLSTHPHQFSGGMRQRIMIAMALACQPKLIIADEPTTALDVTVQAQILELLKELTRETGSALILITHDLGVVARYADRVCVMYGGKVIETASALDLYARPLHPYTRGLMASIPRLDQPAGRRLVPIKGQPPNLAQLPPGCSFNPRCGEVVDRCRRDTPELMKADDKHLHACWVAPHV
jgi:oligopeptide transport system ATP-binding protein